jgi:peptide/nickel transport system permease protein
MKRKNLKLTLGAWMVGLVVALAILAPVLPLQPPGKVHMDSEFASPSWEHPLGQDEEGRDVLSRVIYGARLSLLIGFSVVAISLVAGTLIGMTAGYFGGRADELFVFVGDVFLAFPSILLIIALAAFVPPSVFNIILVLAFVGWVSYARIIRGQVLSLKSSEYIQAAKSLGYSHPRVLFRHLLPNSLSPLIVNATLSLAGVIIAESTLSFLGLGIPPGIPSWGSMLDAGVAYLLIAPHLSIVPGLAIMLTVLGFNFLGDGLRDQYDVREN